MKILVTGGCGFIGSNFILKQINLTNNKVLNIDKLTYSGNIKNLKSIEKNKNYHFSQIDICDKKSVDEVFKEFSPDKVVNFAAESHVDRSIDSPLPFVQTNVLGTANLLDAATSFWSKNKKDAFRFLHVSTDEVYGSLGVSGFFTEDTPYDPKSPYSASKASSDHLVRAWFNTYKLPAVITNCSNNYGPYQFPEKLIPLTIINCLNERSLPVYGNGENIRDWLFVEDHCDALEKVMLNGEAGETYNIGGNTEVKNIDIVNQICIILNRLKPRTNNKPYEKLIKFVKDRPGHDFRYAIDCSKIEKRLNWCPKESFDKGLEKTVNWYLKNESWWKQIQSSNYNQERLGLTKD